MQNNILIGFFPDIYEMNDNDMQIGVVSHNIDKEEIIVLWMATIKNKL